MDLVGPNGLLKLTKNVLEALFFDKFGNSGEPVAAVDRTAFNASRFRRLRRSSSKAWPTEFVLLARLRIG
jgi:hypothetical protein